MSSATLYRWSGIVLLLGALLGVIVSILDSVLYPGSNETAQQVLSPPFTIDASLFLVWALLLAMGLPGLYLRQATRTGVLGFVGFVLIFPVRISQDTEQLLYFKGVHPSGLPAWASR